jgi:hypothetical protein
MLLGPQLARMRSPCRAVAIVVPPQAVQYVPRRIPVPSQGLQLYIFGLRPPCTMLVLVCGPFSSSPNGMV